MSDCTVSDCGKVEFARGWCHMHWNRWRRHGDPLHRERIFGDLAARLRKFTDRRGPDECWPWTGQLNRNGYGRLAISGTKMYAHRVVYETLRGPIPDGYDIDHECHNLDADCPGGWECKHRACVNPRHLVPRTRGENMERAFNRG